MKYKPLFNPGILQQIIDDDANTPGGGFAFWTGKRKIITPVTAIEIDRYNFEQMKGMIDIEELDQLWSDCVVRGCSEKTFLLEAQNFMFSDPDINRGLLTALAGLDEKPARKNINQQWVIDNEDGIRELFRQTGNALGSIREVASSYGIVDEKKIKSYKTAAYRLNFFSEL